MNKLNICVFGGTTEGKMLAELLSDLNIKADLFIKEEHGHRFVKNLEFIQVYSGMTDEKHMIDIFTEKRYNLVIDAVDSYDRDASNKISKLALTCNVKYIKAEINSAGNSSRAVKNAVQTGCLNVEEICDYILYEMYSGSYACI